jgi:hypothetical protein
MQGNLPAKALSFAHWSDARVAQEFTWKSATVTQTLVGQSAL